MAKYVWALNNETGAAGVFTTSVLSMSYNYGRQTYMDNYAGGNIVITIKNNTNQAAGFALNDQIKMTATISGGEVYFQKFWVGEIQYNDYPGNIGMPTATLICQDALNRVGRSLGNGYSIAAGTTGAQVDNMDTAPTWPPNISSSSNGTSSQASATTLTTSFANRINLNQATEKGILYYAFNNAIRLFGRTTLINLKPTPVAASLGRTVSSTVVAYDSFERVALGQNFINSTTVTPDGLSSVTASNASSVATYGQAGQNISTVDANTTQATGLAEWISSSQSDPTALRFVVSYTDTPQTEIALITFSQYLFGSYSYPLVVQQLAYRVPAAAADTTLDVVIEGWQMNVTPEQTRFTLYCSPLTYYQFFTLNSSTLGILDTSRLGW